MITFRSYLKEAVKPKSIIKLIPQDIPKNILFASRGSKGEKIIIHLEKFYQDIIPDTWLISINDVVGTSLNLHGCPKDHRALTYYIKLFNAIFHYIKENFTQYKNSMDNLIFNFPKDFESDINFRNNLWNNLSKIGFNYEHDYFHSFFHNTLILGNNLHIFDKVIETANIDNSVSKLYLESNRYLSDVVLSKEYEQKFRKIHPISHSILSDYELFNFTNKPIVKLDKAFLDKISEINKIKIPNFNYDYYKLYQINFGFSKNELINRINKLNNQTVIPEYKDDYIETIVNMKDYFDKILNLLKMSISDIIQEYTDNIKSIELFLDNELDNELDEKLKFFLYWFKYNYLNIKKNILQFNMSKLEYRVSFELDPSINFLNYIKQNSKKVEVEVFKYFLNKFSEFTDIPFEHLLNLKFTDEDKHKLKEKKDTFNKILSKSKNPKTYQESYGNLIRFQNNYYPRLNLIPWNSDNSNLVDTDELLKNNVSEEEKQDKILFRKLLEDYYYFKDHSNFDETNFLNKFFIKNKCSKEQQNTLIFKLKSTDHYKDTINESELLKITEEFKDSYNPVTANDNKLEEKHNELLKQFSNLFDYHEIKLAVQRYSGAFFNTFNYFMRAAEGRSYDIKDVKFIVNLVKMYFNKDATIKENLIVYRGSRNNAWLKNKIAGDYVIEQGFLSTTLSYAIAKKFNKDSEDLKSKALMGELYEIYIPKGRKGVYIEDVTTMKKEYEILLPPGSLFKILSIENRATHPNKKIKLQSGMIYKLLYLGAVTRDLANMRFDKDEDWQEFKERENL